MRTWASRPITTMHICVECLKCTTCSTEATAWSQPTPSVAAVRDFTDYFRRFLRTIHVAHKALQCSSVTLGKACAIVERLILNFRNRRSRKHYIMLYKQAEDLCKLNCIEFQSA